MSSSQSPRYAMPPAVCPAWARASHACHDGSPVTVRKTSIAPLFIRHTVEDASVKLEPILELSLKLESLDRPHELHVYESGRHGLGLGVRPYDASKTLHPWTAECGRWLSVHGF